MIPFAVIARCRSDIDGNNDDLGRSGVNEDLGLQEHRYLSTSGGIDRTAV